MSSYHLKDDCAHTPGLPDDKKWKSSPYISIHPRSTIKKKDQENQKDQKVKKEKIETFCSNPTPVAILCNRI